MVARQFFIAGYVQGVFFRSSTQAEAERLGLIGWAVNLDDGRVEVLAVGSASGIVELAMWLEHGPSGARVDSIESEHADAGNYEDLQGFRCG
ncbi:MAG: acylphosphatase [Gammaproteobacteria bacterium]|nr:acylphosphatase [Gammaproteobacteria bacterium]MCP4091081.1 acylphosphatase [Gammaproteobacteria bacterium]MCP4277393.1 acylphosphatase [Gammaproteobacteria bacterium]MCP4831546.1 acylphosphatase [Gammaproteobacteria bacterium]MCP4927769.1 acylphosphatase [Gammaproteobacteria bacterium]